jgi:hypothetical protein
VRSEPRAPAAYLFSAMRRLHPGRNYETFQRSNLQLRCLHPGCFCGTFHVLLSNSFPCTSLQMPPLASPFLSHSYKCPGGGGCARPSALFCRSLHQECFTTPFQSNASTLFPKTAGVSPNNSQNGNANRFDFSPLRLLDSAAFRRSWNFPTGLLVLLYKHRPGAGQEAIRYE